jgi:hypothetical protein
MLYVPRVPQDDPASGRLDIPQDRIDLYVELLERPRALSQEEAQMMVELVGAWRGLEHRKHIALTAARAQLGVEGD